jgi:peptidoglycan/LPS O-acetylase OafA/YrhL
MDEIKYRSDIDGLRGVSILAVIAYHYNLGNVDGGFVGVDVFFVISGYLITTIILKEINNGSFSFTNFYLRRIRRIFPAVLFLILVILVAGYFILLPSNYTKIGNSAFYSAFGLSNFYFLWNTDYFDTAAEFRPLLHTWSLAVEEQYYLIWPILLLAIVKLGNRSVLIRYGAIVLLIVMSLVFSQLSLTEDGQKTAFYMFHTRAWELGLGGLIALFPVLKHRIAGTVLSTLGILMIAWSMITLSSDSPFPGLNALYPCIGAGLIILPKQDYYVYRMLSVKPLVFIGKISYSLYLWHWPLLVLYRHHETGRMPDQNDTLILLLLCFILSIFSWRYIEQRFRKKKTTSKKYVYVTGLSTMIGVGVLGMAVSQASGFPHRLPEALRDVEKMTRETVTSQNGLVLAHCFISSKSKGGVKFFSDEKCITIDTNKRNAIIVGDSHAAHFGKALRDHYPGVQFSQVTGSGCLPTLHAKGKTNCAILMRRAIDKAIPSGKYDTVIFSARWTRKGVDRLVEVVEWSKKYIKNVVIFGPTIEYSKALPTLLAKSALRNDGGEIIEAARKYKHSITRSRYLASKLEGLDIQYYSLVDSVCPNDKCIVVDADGKPIQYDYGHFTYRGASLVIESLKQRGLLKQI